MTTTAKKLVRDPTVYPESDAMGEGELQRMMTELLRPMLARLLAEQGRVAHVGANTFLYFEQFNPTRRGAPDIYVLPGVRQGRLERSWKLWEIGVVPSFWLEIVSTTVEKDYETIPNVCAELGVRELVIYDPDARGRRERAAWQVFRQKGKGFICVERTNANQIRSDALRCWLRIVGAGNERRIRVALGSDGNELYPTDAEEKEKERAEKEKERAEKERERAEKERERAEKEKERAARTALETEVSKLRQEIARLRGRRRRSK